MKQMKCPHCGSRTTDVELSTYAGRCIGCRQPSVVPPLIAPTAPQPAVYVAPPPVRMAEAERGPETTEAITTAPAEPAPVWITTTPSEPSLLDGELDAEAAAELGRHYLRAEYEAQRHAANKNMLFGALWCIGGLLVTAVSFAAASGAGGGRYFLAWGAIIFGALQFFRGVTQLPASGHAGQAEQSPYEERPPE